MKDLADVGVNPITLAVRERFRVAAHVGWVVRDAARDVIYGGSWGSRRLYTWTPDGLEVDSRKKLSASVDYQDREYVSPGIVMCSGIAVMPLPYEIPLPWLWMTPSCACT